MYVLSLLLIKTWTSRFDLFAIRDQIVYFDKSSFGRLSLHIQAMISEIREIIPHNLMFYLLQNFRDQTSVYGNLWRCKLIFDGLISAKMKAQHTSGHLLNER